MKPRKNLTQTTFPWDSFNSSLSKLPAAELDEFKAAFDSAITGHKPSIKFPRVKRIWKTYLRKSIS